MRTVTTHHAVSPGAHALTLLGKAPDLGWQVRVGGDTHAYLTAAEAHQMALEWQRISTEIRMRELPAEVAS